MTHDEQIDLDIIMYGMAYEQLLPDGTIQRLDPRNVRCLTARKEDLFKDFTFVKGTNLCDYIAKENGPKE